jgi:cytochrome c oxidase assembly protein subunit 15
MRLRFRHAAAGTTASTLVLMLLGVLTAATGTGLSCRAQWPFCDGGLFPATFASVPEWAHRAVAMLVGFAILGLAVWAWRSGREKRIRYASVAAVLVLPTQVILGAITVTFGGRVPGGYSVPVQAAHFATALTIFGLLAATTAWAARGGEGRARAALLWGAVLAPAYALVSRGLFVPYWTPQMQSASYAFGLALFAALLCGALWSSRPALRRALGATLAVLGLHLLLGRALYAVLPGAATLYVLGTGFVVAATVLAAAVSYRGGLRAGDTSAA